MRSTCLTSLPRFPSLTQACVSLLWPHRFNALRPQITASMVLPAWGMGGRPVWPDGAGARRLWVRGPMEEGAASRHELRIDVWDEDATGTRANRDVYVASARLSLHWLTQERGPVRVLFVSRGVVEGEGLKRVAAVLTAVVVCWAGKWWSSLGAAQDQGWT